MIIRVDPHSGAPIYRQIVDQVRFQVGSDLLVPGTELPSTRALAEKLGVNPMTVSKSYALLEEEGVLERRPGQTLIVAELPPASRERTALQQLRLALEPAATIASHLGIPRKQARRLFRELLKESAAAKEKRKV
jgi:GntR family transcriptional regulator